MDAYLSMKPEKKTNDNIKTKPLLLDLLKNTRENFKNPNDNIMEGFQNNNANIKVDVNLYNLFLFMFLGIIIILLIDQITKLITASA